MTNEANSPHRAGSAVVSGRCYCGAIKIHATQRPHAVAYCHCSDCRRVTAAPVAVFAAFDEAAVSFTPDAGRSVSSSPGVTRTFCADCGSSIAGRYDYLPGQVYIGVGLLDQIDALGPTVHAHEAQRAKWLHINDNLERFPASARTQLNESK